MYCLFCWNFDCVVLIEFKLIYFVAQHKVIRLAKIEDIFVCVIFVFLYVVGYIWYMID